MELNLKYPDWLKKSTNSSLSLIHSFTLANGYNKADVFGLSSQSIPFVDNSDESVNALSLFTSFRLNSGNKKLEFRVWAGSKFFLF